MKKERQTFPQAIVPEHLSKLTVEKLPMDKIYYIEPGEPDDYALPAIFQSPDNKLMMSKSYPIDIDDDCPFSPLSTVGVMRTFVIDDATDQLSEHYVADLRYIGDHTLADTYNLAEDCDQEEYMAWMSQINNSITFSAFIAAEQDAAIKKNGKMQGTFYGNPKLYDALEKVEKHSDKLMKKYVRREQCVKKLAKTAKKTMTSEQSDTKPSENNLSVVFLAP